MTTRPLPDTKVHPGEIANFLRSEEYNYSGCMVVHEIRSPDDMAPLCIIQARLYAIIVLLIKALTGEGLPIESLLERFLKKEFDSESVENGMVTFSRFLVFSGIETPTSIDRVNRHIARLRAEREEMGLL